MYRRILGFIVAVLFAALPAHAQVTTKITGAKLGSVVVTKDGVNPCAGVAVGDPCPNGVLYGGTGFAGLGSYKYMTTPGHCSNFVNNYTPFTPTCTGATDNIFFKWANNSGTTAFNVNTGALSTTAGATNTTTLATNYTDTDAARYCQNMTYPAGGYTDWYLPARNELNLVLYAMDVAGKGNFGSDYYWSSTQATLTAAWTRDFVSGSGETDTTMTGNYHVRCVRKY